MRIRDTLRADPPEDDPDEALDRAVDVLVDLRDVLAELGPDVRRHVGGLVVAQLERAGAMPPRGPTVVDLEGARFRASPETRRVTLALLELLEARDALRQADPGTWARMDRLVVEQLLGAGGGRCA